MSEQVQISQIRLKRVVAPQAQRFRIESKRHVRRISQLRVDLLKSICKSFQIVGGSAVAQIGIVGHARTSLEQLGLPADHQEIYPVGRENFSDLFQRAFHG